MIGLTACQYGDLSGFPGQSAEDISKQSLNATIGAASMRMRVDEVGRHNRPRKLVFAADSAGNCTASVATPGEGRVEIVTRGDRVWAKPDADNLRAKAGKATGARLSSVLGGRYVYGSTADPLLRTYAQACDLKARQEKMAKDGLLDTSVLTKGALVNYKGQETITLLSERWYRKSQMLVATHGTPYVLKYSWEKKDGTLVMTELSGFNEPVTTKIPPAARSLDVADLRRLVPGTW